MPSKPSSVQAEIRQSRPFRSRRQEATIALLRTASVVSRVLERVVEPAGISLAQYNALRIVRGAGTAGIPTLAVRERMIQEGTTITRILDKLEASGLVRRERSTPDRRQVVCHVTPKGRHLLDQLDPKVNDADEKIVAGFGAGELDRLIDTLDGIRAQNAELGAARTVKPVESGG